MADDPKISLVLQARNEARQAVNEAKGGFAGLVSSAKAGMASLADSLLNVKNLIAGFAASRGIGKLFAPAVENERFQVQLKQLLGDVDKAKGRFAELQQFAATTPFQLPGVIKASITLERFTQGVLSTGNGLRLVGDAAAMSNAPIEELALHVGRLYDGIKNKGNIGEPMQRLMELGLISGQTRREIEELHKSGADGEQVWAAMEQALAGNSGAMQDLSQTTAGLISTLKDNLEQTLARISEKSLPAVKDAITALNQEMEHSKAGTDVMASGLGLVAYLLSSIPRSANIVADMAAGWYDEQSGAAGTRRMQEQAESARRRGERLNAMVRSGMGGEGAAPVAALSEPGKNGAASGTSQATREAQLRYAEQYKGLFGKDEYQQMTTGGSTFAEFQAEVEKRLAARNAEFRKRVNEEVATRQEAAAARVAKVDRELAEVGAQERERQWQQSADRARDAMENALGDIRVKIQLEEEGIQAGKAKLEQLAALAFNPAKRKEAKEAEKEAKQEQARQDRMERRFAQRRRTLVHDHGRNWRQFANDDLLAWDTLKKEQGAQKKRVAAKKGLEEQQADVEKRLKALDGKRLTRRQQQERAELQQRMKDLQQQRLAAAQAKPLSKGDYEAMAQKTNKAIVDIHDTLKKMNWWGDE